jgi:(1->4)-alpha-D-glucan 1-alpha-D-glucosylmutase
LDRISEQHRWSRDFTAGTLEQILADTIACFPVYRTYIAAGEAEVTPQDNLHIRAALTAAQRRNPTIDPSVFAFLADVLLMHDPDGLTDAERTERRDFVLRFQQLTGPVMAKGLEDTTFYRYFPLLSLNEVGGGPERFGLPVEEFHRLMEERSRERAGALSATSTHDTKRGEDSRARLNVLSEIPDEWTATVGAWREIAARLRSHLQGEPVPDADDEYYIYQTLVAALPPGQLDQQAMALFVPRVQGAVEKALREAKRNTSWISPNAAYEQGAAEFVAKLLEPGGRFLPRLAEFVRRIHGAGVRGALSQVTLKIGAPGVPDFFQGTELWDLSMVDPDNRRPVDFMARRKWLDAFQGQDDQSRSATFAKLLAAPDDGHIKLCLTAALLDGRRRDRELFTHGSYSPVTAEGDQHDNIIAFARRWQGRVAIVAAGRFFTRLPAQGTGGIWKDTALLLPEELPVFVLRDVVTGREARPRDGRLRVADLFGTLPCALLVGDIEPGRDA